MAMRLTTENVRIIEHDMLSDIEYWGLSADEAKEMLNYISGIHDMAAAVIRAIRELGGN